LLYGAGVGGIYGGISLKQPKSVPEYLKLNSVFLSPPSNLLVQSWALLAPSTGAELQIAALVVIVPPVGAPLSSTIIPLEAIPQQRVLSPPQVSFKPVHEVNAPLVG